MNINTKFKMTLSLDSIEEFENMLKEEKKNLPRIAENIVRRVSEIGLEDNYESTKVLPIKKIENTISGGIKTTEEKDTYKEFGTGIVGSNNPHISEMLAEAGWKYDVNEHGEQGWIYPKGDGTFGWTKGIPASKKFYNAMKKMEREFSNIVKDEMNK